MDYENKYNKALEEARDYYRRCTTDYARKEMETIFPELKENEDERIRKMLIEQMEIWKKCAEDNSVEQDIKDASAAIAYLEKQKDAIGAARQQGYEEGLEDGIKMNMAEQMGESKEWADELSAEIDRISKRYPEVSFVKLSRVAIHFVRWQKEHKPNVELIQKSWYLEGYHDGKYNNEPKWLIQTGKGGPMYEENPKYGTQKTAEWSEEDENEYNHILKTLNLVAEEQETKGYNNLIRSVDWLKSLLERFSLQPKQEWSEKDKLMIHNIVLWLDGQFISEAARMQCLEWFNKHRRDFLIQPHWKPSEEQMEALKLIVSNKKHYAPVLHEIALDTLYNELKKL